MTTKKTNENKMFENVVRTRVRALVTEALTTFAQLEEAGAEVNPVFNKVADKDALIKWLMGYYFKPERKDQPWWSKKVNPKNILAYVSNQANHFPLTPREVVDDWNIKKSLKGDLGGLRDDEVEAFEKNEPEGGAVYNTGEKPLKAIGKEMGGLTAAMINKIEKSGMEHFLKTVAGKNPMDMSEDELDDLLQKVDEARLETSFEFARDLKAAKNNVKQFVASLVKKQILAPTDVRMMKPREVEMLLFLMNKPEDQVAEYLRGDAQKVDNRIKSFQAAVARKLYPAGRRGRPRLQKPTT